MKQAMKEIMSRPFSQDEEIRPLIPSAWKRIMKQMYKWSPSEKDVIKAGLDEVEILTSASDFLANELGINEISIYLVGNGEDIGGKAKFAFPSEPGIAYI